MRLFLMVVGSIIIGLALLSALTWLVSRLIMLVVIAGFVLLGYIVWNIGGWKEKLFG